MAAVIPQGIACKRQLAAIAGNEPESSFLEIRPLDPDGRPAVQERTFVPVRELDRAAYRVSELADDFNVYVGAAPRVRENGTTAAIDRVWTLWADLDGPDALKRLRQFRPLPSIVVRSGSDDHAHAYWPLNKPLSPTWARRANLRLAGALGADRGSTDAARALRPAGTLNHKHEPPRPVHCTRLELDVFTFDQVVGGLADDADYALRKTTGNQPLSARPANLLEGLTRVVREAPVGNRNRALFWAACRAREHVDTGELGHDQAHDHLRHAATAAGLPEHEALRTIRSGLDESDASAAA